MALKKLLQDFLGVSSHDSQLETTSTDSESPYIEHSLDQGVTTMSSLSLSPLNSIDGFVGACLVDSDSGMVLGLEGGGGLNLEMAAAGNTEVVRAKRKTMKSLGLNDSIEDILISLGTQYHLIRPLDTNDAVFVYLALDRNRSNLGMARMQLKKFEKDLDLS